jgi:hypothetical protein
VADLYRGAAHRRRASCRLREASELEGFAARRLSETLVSSVVPVLTRSYRHLAGSELGVPFYLGGASDQGVEGDVEAGEDRAS